MPPDDPGSSAPRLGPSLVLVALVVAFDALVGIYASVVCDLGESGTSSVRRVCEDDTWLGTSYASLPLLGAAVAAAGAALSRALCAPWILAAGAAAGALAGAGILAVLGL